MRNRKVTLVRTACFLVLIIIGIIGAVVPAVAQAGSVYVIQVEDEIDGGLSSYIQRILSKADSEGASAVIVRINTPGGALDAALDIKDAILNSPLDTIAFVDRQAFSAGALVAIACDSIYMEPGATLGAATPIYSTGEVAGEKTISAVRAAFASTAEANGRNPIVAEAMVDPAVEIDGLIESGKLLTLTTSQALEWGYANGEVDTIYELLTELGLDNRELVTTSPGPAETLVRFLTNSIVSAVLIVLGFLGLLFELITPGFGIGGIVGLVCLGLFFFGHVLAGFAGWEGIVLVLAGLVLIALEAFVIPGFGVAGILGILALFGGLYISMVDDFSSSEQLTRAGWVIAGSLVALIIGAWALFTFIPKKRSFKGLFLVESVASIGRPKSRGQESGEVVPSETYSLIGSKGVAVSKLRPAGIAEIHGKRVDVVTEGDWIEAGTSIEVVEDTGYRRVVKAVPKEDRNEGN